MAISSYTLSHDCIVREINLWKKRTHFIPFPWWTRLHHCCIESFTTAVFAFTFRFHIDKKITTYRQKLQRFTVFKFIFWNVFCCIVYTTQTPIQKYTYFQKKKKPVTLQVYNLQTHYPCTGFFFNF